MSSITERMSRSFRILAVAAVMSGCSVTLGGPAPAYARADEVYDIPPGQMPPPGSCRVWHPGAPPGQQPPPGDCNELREAAPPDTWLLYRPNEDSRVFRID